MSPAAPYTIASNSCQRKPPMPLPDRNPKSRCQTALMSRSQPITMATPIDDASGTAIARKPHISIRMPQIISGLPVSAADIELVIRTSSLNHRRQSSSSPASRFHLLPAFCCNASLDVGQNSPPPSHRGSFGGTRTQATGGECKTKNVLRCWRLGTPHLLLLFGRYNLSGLARIPRVDYKRKPNMTSFLNQLKQRRVYRVAIGYAIVAWLMVQIAATVFPAFHAPEFVLPVLIVMLGGGFRTQLRWRGLFK